MIPIAIKAGQILHVMNKFIVDRIQTAGASNLNIPTEKVYELGNFQSVAIVRDVPDLTFTLDCLDVSTEVESILTGGNPGGPMPNEAGDPWGTKYTIGVNHPADIISPMKSNYGAFDIVKGVAVPYLTLESVSYRYGLRENAGENYSLRGDSIFYVPGDPRLLEITTDGSTDTFSFKDRDGANTAALKYVEQGETFYALSVTCDDYRLVHGVDYTDDEDGFTLTQQYKDAYHGGGNPNGKVIRVVYGITIDGDPDEYDESVHQGVMVKPAAIRGKDIQVYVGTVPVGNNRGAYANETEYASGDVVFYNGVWYEALTGVPDTNTDAPVEGATWGLAETTEFRWSDVQSVNVDWRVTLEDDFEFGNPRAVTREPTDAPEVSGNIELKPMTVDALFAKLNQITGVPATDIVGPQSSVVLPIEVQLRNPDSGGVPAGTVVNGKTIEPGTVLKTLYVPDARFTIPGFEGRANQKAVMTMEFESDGGLLEIFKGSRADHEALINP